MAGRQWLDLNTIRAEVKREAGSLAGEPSRLYDSPNPLALVPGARLGSYEIVAALGAGGMGEVYRATDTKLKRQVALKSCQRQWPVTPSGSPDSSAKRKCSRR